MGRCKEVQGKLFARAMAEPPALELPTMTGGRFARARIEMRAAFLADL